MNTISTKNQILCALFAALIAVGAFIKIPVPVVPFTLQFLFTTLAGILLGKNLGALSVLLYILLGLLGLPVFAEGGGFGYIFKPSFGYLIGFAIGAYVSGYFAEQSKRPSLLLLLMGNLFNLLLVYAFGMVYYYAICNYYLGNPLSVGTLIMYCFVLAVPGDAVLCVTAAFLGKRLLPILRGSH